MPDQLGNGGSDLETALALRTQSRKESQAQLGQEERSLVPRELQVLSWVTQRTGGRLDTRGLMEAQYHHNAAGLCLQSALCLMPM